MSSKIATIEVYPNYNEDGSVNLDLDFSYGCPELDLMGYSGHSRLIQLTRDIREKLKKHMGGTDCGSL